MIESIKLSILSVVQVLLFVMLAVLLILYINVHSSQAANYDYINFQGKLTASNGIAVPSGN